MGHYKSKTGIIAKPRERLFEFFSSFENLAAALPSHMLKDVTIEKDRIQAHFQGEKIVVGIVEAVAPSKVVVKDIEAPMHAKLTLHMEEAAPGCTAFSMEADTDLGFMMEAMLGRQIPGFLDKAVDTLANGGVIA